VPRQEIRKACSPLRPSLSGLFAIERESLILVASEEDRFTVAAAYLDKLNPEQRRAWSMARPIRPVRY
jgi:hypothetical protein